MRAVFSVTARYSWHKSPHNGHTGTLSRTNFGQTAQNTAQHIRQTYSGSASGWFWQTFVRGVSIAIAGSTVCEVLYAGLDSTKASNEVLTGAGAVSPLNAS